VTKGSPLSPLRPDVWPQLAAHPLAILGPTASGKSSLALAIHDLVKAQLGWQVELVSIDSMQVYRGMDIGTAKPSLAEQARVPHHLIDLVDPADTFAVGEFQSRARQVLADVVDRGSLPVLVGGTGLYLRAVIDDLRFPGRFPEVAVRLDNDPDTEALHHQLTDLDPVSASRMEPTNRRRILRALEVTLGSGQPFSSFGPGLETYPDSRFVQVALDMERDLLNARIEARYRQQFEDGFLEEVRWVSQQAPSRTARQALGYRELLAHVEEGLPFADAVELAIIRTRKFARRQLRWFRRDPRVHWVPAPADPQDVLHRWQDEATRLTSEDRPSEDHPTEDRPEPA
jgi:tRNA dimethylallyltransferase